MSPMKLMLELWPVWLTKKTTLLCGLLCRMSVYFEEIRGNAKYINKFSNQILVEPKVQNALQLLPLFTKINRKYRLCN